MSNGKALALNEDVQIATINEQITEIENNTASIELVIEEHKAEIRRLQRLVRSNGAKVEKLRDKRKVFAEAAVKIRMIDMP
jgi:predicted RNase H-like nuclease (RuvC/YqgF family)